MKWSLVDKWKREEWQKKSDIASKNRKQSTRVAHTGGSASMTTHSMHLRSGLGRPATYKEVFDRMHQDKNGDFVNEKAKKVSISNEHYL
ncbi:putative Transposon, En/Spm-like protein [Cocos nucifera]|nr:putative Transposon, En/Spm-like protein [Cocos nucifera]